MARLIEDEAGIAEMVRGMKRVAVLGIKTEEQRGQPAFGVPEYLDGAGIEIVPVPVYYPDVTQILGEKVYRSVNAILKNGLDKVPLPLEAESLAKIVPIQHANLRGAAYYQQSLMEA